jgi:hypothetical protein
LFLSMWKADLRLWYLIQKIDTLIMSMCYFPLQENNHVKKCYQILLTIYCCLKLVLTKWVQVSTWEFPKVANDVFVLEVVNFLDAHWHPKHVTLFESTNTRSSSTILNVFKVLACHYTRLSLFRTFNLHKVLNFTYPA